MQDAALAHKRAPRAAKASCYVGGVGGGGDGRSAEELQGGLRQIQRGVLATLALAFAGIALGTESGDLDALDRSYTMIALLLGIGSILARTWATNPRVAPVARVRLAIASLLIAASIGLLGVALAVRENEREAGLLFTLAGAILALRVPPIAARRPGART